MRPGSPGVSITLPFPGAGPRGRRWAASRTERTSAWHPPFPGAAPPSALLLVLHGQHFPGPSVPKPTSFPRRNLQSQSGAVIPPNVSLPSWKECYSGNSHSADCVPGTPPLFIVFSRYHLPPHPTHTQTRLVSDHLSGALGGPATLALCGTLSQRPRAVSGLLGPRKSGPRAGEPGSRVRAPGEPPRHACAWRRGAWCPRSGR